MTRKQLKEALKKHKERKAQEEASARIERKVVAGYPATHNPYIPHVPQSDCYSGCVHVS